MLFKSYFFVVQKSNLHNEVWIRAPICTERLLLVRIFLLDRKCTFLARASQAPKSTLHFSVQLALHTVLVKLNQYDSSILHTT